MKKIYKLFALLLAAAMLFSLAACGNKESKPEATPTPETVYASQFTTFSGTYDRNQANFNVLLTDEDGFIGTVNEKVGEREPYEGETLEYEGQFDIYEPRLCAMDFTGKMTKLEYEPLRVEFEGEDAELNSWLAGLAKTDGGFVVIEEAFAYWNNAPAGVERYSDDWYQYGVYEDRYYIRRLDAAGRELKSAPLDMDFERNEDEYFNPGRFVLLDENTLLTSGERALYAFNVDTGNYLYKIDAADVDWIMNLLQVDDGTVYVVGYGQSADGSYRPTIRPVEAQSRRLGTPLETEGDFYSAIPGNDRYLFYYNSGNWFCGLNKATMQEERLFNWINVDVISDDLRNYAVLPDGSVVGLLTEWDKNYENATVTLMTVREVPYASLPQKTVLTLATDGMDWNVQRQLVKFNRASDSVRIELLDYSEYDDYEADYDDNGFGENGGMTKLRTEILSGKMPDILDLAGMPTRQLAAKGLLMDLYPLLDADPALSRGDIFPNVLKALEINGKLCSVSSGFYIQTCIGARRVVGDTPGWTFEDLNRALATMPEGCTVFGISTTRDVVLQTMLELDMGQFVDWDTGKVSFESPEFIALLNFVKAFPATFDWQNHEWAQEDEDYYRVRQGQQLLLDYYLSDLSDLSNYESIFGGPNSYTFIGYPTGEGVGSLLRMNNGFAISRDCKDPQAAWQFLRILLTEDYEADWNYNFPANRRVFEKQKQDAMTPTYVKDADGNIQLDPETGEKQMEIKGWSYDMVTMEDIPIYVYTAEQLETVEQMIVSTERVPDFNKALIDIVREQAQPFFAGQRTAEEVAKFVQSKANIYVNEQR